MTEEKILIEPAELQWKEGFPQTLRENQLAEKTDNIPKIGRSLGNIWIIFQREFKSYFASPIAYIVMTVFLVVIGWITLSGGLSFGDFQGDFFERGRNDLEPMFKALPWLFLFFVPAIAMRLWAEEKQVGSFEILMTMPMNTTEILLGKFFGAWAFTALMLVATFPFPIILSFLGEPDYGQIVASYIGGIFLAGAFLSIGTFVSSLTRDQIIAFISGIFISGFFVLLGSEATLEFLTKINHTLARIAGRVALSERFDSIAKGILDIGDMLYYLIFIGFFIYLTIISLKFKRL